MQDNKEIKKFRKFNKIIIKHCTKYYFVQYTERNRVLYELGLQKEVLTKQVIRLQREVQERGIITKRFARAHPINLQYATV